VAAIDRRHAEVAQALPTARHNDRVLVGKCRSPSLVTSIWSIVLETRLRTLLRVGLVAAEEHRRRWLLLLA
jgi:hypothetical protein